jgi:hypothetical protein
LMSHNFPQTVFQFIKKRIESRTLWIITCKHTKQCRLTEHGVQYK